jgi:hypothetical protein
MPLLQSDADVQGLRWHHPDWHCESAGQSLEVVQETCSQR